MTIPPIKWLTYASPALWGYVGVTYSIANTEFPGNCGNTYSNTEVTCSLQQSGNLIIFDLGFNNLSPLWALIFLVAWITVFFFSSWLLLARPWDKGARKAKVVTTSTKRVHNNREGNQLEDMFIKELKLNGAIIPATPMDHEHSNEGANGDSTE